MQTEITLNSTAVANVTDRCDDPNSVTSFDKTSIVNIYSQPDTRALQNETSLLWAHLVALYLITFIVLKVWKMIILTCPIWTIFREWESTACVEGVGVQKMCT